MDSAGVDVEYRANLPVTYHWTLLMNFEASVQYLVLGGDRDYVVSSPSSSTIDINFWIYFLQESSYGVYDLRPKVPTPPSHCITTASALPCLHRIQHTPEAHETHDGHEAPWPSLVFMPICPPFP